ncbi:MAG: hypothetical protein LBD97_10545 [Bifidobacteriaceae bacterium]|nr:hypothetical protein [Bifidobacteriaceae bacterium]
MGALLAAGAALSVPADAAGPSDGSTVVFKVNSTQFHVDDSDCWSGPVCTLSQALWDAALVGPDLDLRIEADVDGVIEFPTNKTYLPVGDQISPWDKKGAAFHVERPMEIDMGHRLGLAPKNGTAPSAMEEVAAMFVDAPGVKLKNFSNWFSYQSVFVFSDNSDGSSLVGGESIQTANNHTNRQVVLMPGADDITISDYTMGRQASDGTSGGIALTKLATSSTGTISRTTISNVVFDNASDDQGGCDQTSGTTCSSNGLYITNSVAVDGLTLRASEFKNFTRTSGNPVTSINASEAGAMSNWLIENNRFVETRNGSLATLQLPTIADLPGPVHIRGNVFDNGKSAQAGSPKQSQAISFERKETTGSRDASGLFIEDNHFDGYVQTIRLQTAGAVTVRRNTFGLQSGSSSGSTTDKTNDPLGTSGEETGMGDTNLMFTNHGRATNRAIRTWWPIKQATASACGVSFTVATNDNVASEFQPAYPLDLDVYWTAGATAEVYLGTLKGLTGASGVGYTLEAALPAGGAIRLQTQGAGGDPDWPDQQESSQYSRAVPVSGTTSCATGVGIALQAWTDVPPEATTYADIIGSDATPLGDGAVLTSGAEVWFTYTVTNTGQAMLRRVLVGDTDEASVCVITDLTTQSQAGCARRAVLS